MALTSNCGFFLTKLIVLAIIVNLAFSAEVINGENPREFFAVEGVNSQDVPVIVLSDNYYEKRSNLNKFKNFMINKDNVNIAPDETLERDEQVFYIPRINHSGAGKRGAVLSWAPIGNKLRYGNLNYRQPPSNFGSARQAA